MYGGSWWMTSNLVLHQLGAIAVVLITYIALAQLLVRSRVYGGDGAFGLGCTGLCHLHFIPMIEIDPQAWKLTHGLQKWSLEIMYL